MEEALKSLFYYFTSTGGKKGWNLINFFKNIYFIKRDKRIPCKLNFLLLAAYYRGGSLEQRER